MKTFYLGTHQPYWLTLVDVPLFLSDTTLRKVRKLPRAMGIWAADSGGFSELKEHGTWTVPAREYAERVKRYQAEIGGLQWAAVQDWMTEPVILEKTGLTVEQHQDRTIDSLIELRSLAPEVPWCPVLQGWRMDEHWRHFERYLERGIDLRLEPIVGIGSVCRRQDTFSASNEIATLARVAGLKLHGFGFKTKGLMSSPGLDLESADSLAWSFNATKEPPLPGHDKPGPGRIKGHKSCSNCLDFALMWRDDMLARVAFSHRPKPPSAPCKADHHRGVQASLAL